jgi:predicted PurR-regulated permease PerM
VGEPGHRGRNGRKRLAWGVGSVAALLGLVWLAMAVRSVSIPLLLAFILAYFLAPVVKTLAKRGLPPPAAIALILVGAALVLFGAGALLGPQLAEEFADLPEKTRDMAERLMAWAETRFDVDLGEARAELRSMLAERIGELDQGAVAGPASRVLAAIYGGAMGTFSVLVGLVMTVVFTFFMLRDFDRLVAAARELVPPRFRPFVGDRAREIDRAMSSFLRGQLSVAGILAVLYVVGFLIVGLPLAVAVGLIAGLGNVIPFVGTAVGVVLATGLVLMEDPGWTMLLSTWGVFVVVQLLEGWVITPRIVGESLDLSPFVVIVAVLVFGELFGFVGVLVAVPLTAVIKILGKSLLTGYRESAFFAEAEAETAAGSEGEPECPPG